MWVARQAEVGYNVATFAVSRRNDNWGKTCNGQHPLLKKSA